MQSLTMDEIEQVGGGLTFLRGTYGIFILWDGGPVVQPHPGSVIPEL